MCGIFGVLLQENSKYSPKFLTNTVNSLFLLSESRGKEASGAVIYARGNLISCKDAMPAHRLIRTKKYKHFFDNAISHRVLDRRPDIAATPIVVIGNTRLATNGIPQNDNNN